VGVGADVALADVIAPNNDDVGLLGSVTLAYSQTKAKKQ
jgi:hypothetical protein